MGEDEDVKIRTLTAYRELMYCKSSGRVEENAAQFIHEGGFTKTVIAFVV
jgi:hypothetical protein